MGISRGRLTLTGDEVAQGRSSLASQILASVDGQLEGCRVKHILVVGGFGESPYLRKKLTEWYEAQGIKIITADEPSKKAVAEGAALFYIKDFVVARATRFDFGIQTTRKLSSNSESALGRKVYRAVDGEQRSTEVGRCSSRKGRLFESDQLVTEVFNYTFRSKSAMLYRHLIVF